MFHASWSSQCVQKINYFHNDTNHTSAFSLEEYLDSAPCPPPWNISLLCDHHNNRYPLDCKTRTLLLEKCLDGRVTQELLSIFKKCSQSLTCDSYVHLCHRKLSNNVTSRKACALIHDKTTHQNILVSDSKTTTEAFRTEARTSASSDSINAGAELQPSNATMELNVTSYIAGNLTVEYNATIYATVNESAVNVSATESPSGIPSVTRHVHSTDLSVLWFLLILPYCFIIVPCLVHFCIKRR